MENNEYSVIIEFRYGIDDNDPFYELSEKLHERMENGDAPGRYDGHEIAMDNFDARLYFFTETPQETLTYVEDILSEYKFLRGGRIQIRHGIREDSFTEIEIISPDGKRTPLSRFDAEQISAIPEWGDRGNRYANGESGEEWKDKIKNERAERLYNKWREIDYLIEAIWDKWDLSGNSLPMKNKETKEQDEDDEIILPKELIEWHREEMRRNSMIIPPKISGAEAGDLYILRMENAAIIRKAAMDIYLDCHMLTEEKVAEEQDVYLLRAEINLFREYFIDWVNGFENDAFEDDWGLFRQ